MSRLTYSLSLSDPNPVVGRGGDLGGVLSFNPSLLVPKHQLPGTPCRYRVGSGLRTGTHPQARGKQSKEETLTPAPLRVECRQVSATSCTVDTVSGRVRDRGPVTSTCTRREEPIVKVGRGQPRSIVGKRRYRVNLQDDLPRLRGTVEENLGGRGSNRNRWSVSLGRHPYPVLKSQSRPQPSRLSPHRGRHRPDHHTTNTPRVSVLTWPSDTLSVGQDRGPLLFVLTRV